MARRKSRKKTALWNLLFSYGMIGYAVISGIALVPLYLRFIPVDLYGAWLATGNVLAWLTVVDPGIAGVVQQRIGVAYGQRNYSALRGYATGGVLLTMLIALLVLVAGWGTSRFLPNWVNLGDAESAEILRKAFLVAIVGSALMLLAFTVNALNYGLLGSIGPGVAGFVGSFGSLALIPILLINGWGVHAIAAGLLFRGAVMLTGSGGYFIWRTRNEGINLAPDFSKIREMLGLLSFTSIGRVGTTLSLHTDAFIISRFLGPETVPIYMLTKRAFHIGETLITRTGNAVSAGISHLSGEANHARVRLVINRLLKINIWLLGLAFGGFFAFNETFVTLWVGKEFFAGFLISSLFCLFLTSRVFLILMTTLCVALGDIKVSSIVAFVHSLIVFSLMIAGVYYLGILGAALAPLIAYSMVYFWYYPKSLTRRAHLQRSDWMQLGREVAKVTVMSVAFASVLYHVPIGSWLAFAVAIALFAVLYGGGLYWISGEARMEMRGLAQGFWNRFRKPESPAAA